MLRKISIGTRASKLALKQADLVQAALLNLGILTKDDIEIIPIVTSGDKFATANLAKIGGKGLFIKEIEEALLVGKIDIAVHSLKDVPGQIAEHSIIKAVLKREDPRDIFLSRNGLTLAQLPIGALIGTSSPRRQVQLLALRPDLQITYFRGNIDTRLAKLKDGVVDATLLAIAGVKRLELHNIKYEILAENIMLPAIAQGAIGLQIRENDFFIANLLEQINDRQSFIETATERSFLQGLEASCLSPVAALAQMQGKMINFQYMISTQAGVYLSEMKSWKARGAEGYKQYMSDEQRTKSSFIRGIMHKKEVSLTLGQHLEEAYEIGQSLKTCLLT